MELVSMLSGLLIILITGITLLNGILTQNSTTSVPFLNQNGFNLQLKGNNRNETNTSNNISFININNTSVIISSNITTASSFVITTPANLLNNTLVTVASIITPTTVYPEKKNDTFGSQVSLHLSYNKEFVCGGTIIDSKYIVTVAHCMYYRWGGILPPIIVTLYTGRRNLSDNFYYQYEVEDIFFHKSYNESTLTFNIALIKTKQFISFDNKTSKAVFGDTRVKYKSCIVTGWNKISKQLEALDVQIINCTPALASEGVLCANTLSNKTLCNHSEGSSLICKGELIGILSSEPSCGASNQIAVFQDLLQSAKWLTDNGINDIRASSAIRSCIMEFFLVFLIFCTWLT